MGKLASPIFKGCATALATPFRDGEIDFESFKKMIERQIASGVSALVICGTTGEASTMSVDEHLACVEVAIETVRGRIPVIAGSGSNCTKKAITLSKASCELGADALLVVTPYYNKASETGLIKHFLSIADSVEKPLILYNVPTRTGVSISLPVYEALAEHDNIVAVKEASGNISQIIALASRLGDKLDIYSGNDDQILPILSIGGAGVISVVSNLVPSDVERLCKAYFSGDTKLAKELQLSLIDLISTMFCEVNPIPLKHALSLMGLCMDEMRLPLCEASPESRMKIKKSLLEHGLI